MTLALNDFWLFAMFTMQQDVKHIELHIPEKFVHAPYLITRYMTPGIIPPSSKRELGNFLTVDNIYVIGFLIK